MLSKLVERSMPLKPWATCLPVWTAQVHIAEGLSLYCLPVNGKHATRNGIAIHLVLVGASHNSAGFGLCNEVLIYGRGRDFWGKYRVGMKWRSLFVDKISIRKELLCDSVICKMKMYLFFFILYII